MIQVTPISDYWNQILNTGETNYARTNLQGASQIVEVLDFSAKGTEIHR